MDANVKQGESGQGSPGSQESLRCIVQRLGKGQQPDGNDEWTTDQARQPSQRQERLRTSQHRG